jgi:hypothetical protein
MRVMVMTRMICSQIILNKAGRAGKRRRRRKELPRNKPLSTI